MLIGIYENEFVKCELDDSIPLLRHRWLSPPPGEEFKFNLLRILEEYIQLKKSYANLAWLADTKLLGELDQDVEEWLVDEWEGFLFNKASVQIHAVILGESIFADYPMEKFKSDAEEKFRAKKIRLGVFQSEREAMDWIQAQMH